MRGLRITVYEVLEYLASEMSEAEILDDFPDLTREDLKACIAYAADRERRFMNATYPYELLFDENLSPKLPNRLSDLFPNSLHVRDVDMKATIDPIVWDYAKDSDLMIVSKDADMHDLSLVFGNPPKVIWLRLGNCSTLQVENLLRREFKAIKLFYENKTLSLLALS